MVYEKGKVGEVGVNIPSGLREEYENILKYRESIKYMPKAKLILLIIFFHSKYFAASDWL